MDDKALERQLASKESSRSSTLQSNLPKDEEDAFGSEEPPTLPDGLIGRVLSKTISRCSVPDPGPPPDGGLQAWIQVLLSHVTVFTCWGFINSFGVFQTYYVTALHHPPSDISWVGSVQIFLIFFVGTLSGRALDYGAFRFVYALGGFFVVFGTFMASISTRYYQLFLAQGVCTGLGFGLLFCPTVSLTATYFSKKRALAISCAASGTATGGIVYPIIVQQALPKLGFGWTMRIIAFVMLFTLGICLAFMKTRLPPRKSGPLVEWHAFREKPYLLFCTGCFFIFWSLYFAFYYIGSFARDILHVSLQDSINLILIINGVGLPGRIIPGIIADRFLGPLNGLLCHTFVSCLLLYCWTAVHSQGGLIAFCVIYGAFAAGIQSLFPATLTSLTDDIRKTGVRIGMCFSVISFSSLTGPPLAGALVQKDHGHYLYAQMFAGSSMFVGGCFLLAARYSKSGLGITKV